MHRIQTFAASALAIALVAGGAIAQGTVPAAAASNAGMGQMGHMDNMGGKQPMENMMGMHKMPATVTDVDASAGLVGVTAGGMALKLHFPPAAMKNLKAGDKITVHMGFSKP